MELVKRFIFKKNQPSNQLRSISDICLRPVRLLVLIAFAFFLVLGFLVTTWQFFNQIEFETAAINNIMPIVSRSLSAEILSGDMSGIQAVQADLVEKYNLNFIQINPIYSNECPNSNVQILFKKLSFLICREMPLKPYAPNKVLKIVKIVRFTFGRDHILSLLFSCVTLFIFAICTAIVFQRSLKKHVIIPVQNLRNEFLPNVQRFLSGADVVSPLKNPGLSREFTEYGEFTENVVRNLRIAIEERSALEARKASTEAVLVAARMIAHDVRTPMRSLALLLEMLNEAAEIEKRDLLVSRMLPDIHVMLSSLEEVIRGILKEDTFKFEFQNSHLETDRLMEKQSLGVYYLAHKAFALCGFDLDKSDSVIKINLEVPRNLNILGNKSQLLRVFTNLIQNAQEAIKERGFIRLKASLQTDDIQFPLVIELSNSGPLIPAEFLKRMFEPGMTLGKANGTGLGLAIVKDIVIAHGGSIEAFSEIGKEVTFQIKFPLATNSENSNLSVSGSAINSEPWIAIIDDNPLIRTYWSIENMPLPVVSFASPQQFLTHLQLSGVANIRAVVTDQWFDEVESNSENAPATGLQLTEYLRDNHFNLKIYLCTNDCFGEEILNRAGVRALFAKAPADLKRLKIELLQN